MKKIKDRRHNQVRRARRVRKNLRGTADKPRLCVQKTNKHIFAQIIDDEAGKTLVCTSTFSKDLGNTEFNKKNKASARKLGEILSERAKEQNISCVVFDRGPSKYHGVLAELADAAREGGLKL